MRQLLAAAAVAALIGTADALYSKKSPVQTVDPSSLKQLLKGDGVVLLEFFAPWCGHCRNLVPEMDKTAKALKGIVTVAALDADQHKEIAGQFQVQGFPTIVLFGEDRNKPVQYNGGRTAKDMASFALREAGKVVDARLGLRSSSSGSKGGSGKKGDAVELTEDNFEETVLQSKDLWLVEFYAPWCGHCKNLAPEWAQAATELKGSGARLGMVDATVHQHLASKYGVQGYPTIKVFSKNGVEDYDGPRSASGIVDYTLGKLDKLGMGLTLEEFTSRESLEACLEKKSLCTVVVLPHVMDTGAKGRNEYIETFEAAAKKVRPKMMTFGWISGGDQSHFEEVLGLEFNYPTFVAINQKKMRYAQHAGAFTMKGLTESLRKIESGRAPTKPLKGKTFVEKFEKTTPWDGKDYVPPQEEEI